MARLTDMGMEGLPDLAEPHFRRWLIVGGLLLAACGVAIIVLWQP